MDTLLHTSFSTSVLNKCFHRCQLLWVNSSKGLNLRDTVLFTLDLEPSLCIGYQITIQWLPYNTLTHSRLTEELTNWTFRFNSFCKLNQSILNLLRLVEINLYSVGRELQSIEDVIGIILQTVVVIQWLPAIPYLNAKDAEELLQSIDSHTLLDVTTSPFTRDNDRISSLIAIIFVETSLNCSKQAIEIYILHSCPETCVITTLCQHTFLGLAINLAILKHYQVTISAM